MKTGRDYYQDAEGHWHLEGGPEINSVLNSEGRNHLERAARANKEEGRQVNEGEKGSNQADKLIALAREHITNLFTDELGRPYAAFLNANNLLEVLPVRSGRFHQWVRNLAYETWRKVPYPEAQSSAINTLEGIAVWGREVHPLSVRIANWDGGIYYDLGDWRAVRITAEGWDIVASLILFRRFDNQIVQTEPQMGGNIKALLKFLPAFDLSKEILMLVSLVVSLVPGIPQPVLVLHRPQGSGKSTIFRLLSSLVDPSRVPYSAPQSNVMDLIQHASHRYCVFYDNLGYLPDWSSDALCRLSTGEALSKRQLYTDDDEFTYSFRRFAGINGRNLVVTQADLLDRSLIFKLERFENGGFKTERELLQAFETEKADILGGVFDVLSKAMAIETRLKIAEYPRMADFYRWALAVSLVMGYAVSEFKGAFKGNVDSQNSEALESSLVAQALLRFMDGKESWEGTPTGLLEGLNQVATEREQRAKEWPKAANWLWKRLELVVPNLSATGLQIKDCHDGNKRFISVNRSPFSVKEEKMLLVPLEDPENKANLDTNGIPEDVVSMPLESNSNTKNAVSFEGMGNQIRPNSINGINGINGIFPTPAEKQKSKESNGPDPWDGFLREAEVEHSG